MIARELIRNPVLSYGQTAFILGVSTRTLYRWEEQNRLPRSAELVLKSIWSGLPVLTNLMYPGWRDWRFDKDGYFRSPGNYPFGPGDLWALEFLYVNGLFSSAARGELQSNRRMQMHLAKGGKAPAWHPRTIETAAAG